LKVLKHLIYVNDKDVGCSLKGSAASTVRYLVEKRTGPTEVRSTFIAIIRINCIFVLLAH